MKIEVNKVYHVFNQGNNREKIFFLPDNYAYFLRLYKKFVAQHCRLLAWCLMPNHFHFLIYTTESSVKTRQVGSLSLTLLSDGFRQLQSSYAKAINEQEKRTGSLFRQKVKMKAMHDGTTDYALTAFHYIHQNPLKAGLVNRLEQWEYSSFRNYAGDGVADLINVEQAAQLLGLDLTPEIFVRESYQAIKDDLIERIQDRQDRDV